MISDAERAVLAEIESAFRRNDARLVARFDKQHIAGQRWRPADIGCMVALFVVIVVWAAGGGAAVAACLCLITCATIALALRRAMNRRARRHQETIVRPPRSAERVHNWQKCPDHYGFPRCERPAAARILVSAACASALVPKMRRTAMDTNRLLVDVSDELFWDPKVDPEEIAVSADDNGTVTLRGTVGSLRQKSEAKSAAERVWGVSAVKNELKVRILDQWQREDAELRGDVLQALVLDSLVPTSVDAKVSDGWVTLTGTADYQYQREEAAFVAGNILGIFGVDNEILLTETPNPGDVANDIKKSFKRSAKLDATNLTVDSANGTITLSGTVRSWSERDDAVASAWASPGVRDVRDQLTVVY